jgi:hypothetical protein
MTINCISLISFPAKIDRFRPTVRICDPRLKPPREARLAPHLLCFFFGSKNYAWVEEAKISDYDSNRYKLRPARLTHNLKEAIEAIEAALTRAKQEKGGCHDQADAEWIVIRRPLKGHNDMPYGRPTTGRPIGRPGVGYPQSIFGAF